MSKGNTTWTYTYDANGMRTSRTNGTKTYNYVYNGSQLTQMTVGSDTLYFTYGAMGPATVTWDGYTYYYVLNGQGDVTAILDEDGIPVVWYNWNNAWGYNPRPEGLFADTLGVLNPLRYRSYVYDTETGYYYLQSRYYDPEIGRFINADAFIATGQGMLGNNMFAYCLNNPVNFLDPYGNASIWFYLMLYSDWGFIHRKVVQHIDEHYNVTTEVRLKTYGRADIIQGSAVWEVKHAGVDPAGRTIEAMAQAIVYCLFNGEIDHLGGQNAFSGTFTIKCGNHSYGVTYTTPAIGAVLYTVTEISNYKGKYYAEYTVKTKKEETRTHSIYPGLVYQPGFTTIPIIPIFPVVGISTNLQGSYHFMPFYSNSII